MSKTPVSLTQSLPTPKALLQKMPATLSQKNFVEQTRSAIKRTLSGEDSRHLLITGPCSIHDPKSALEYAEKLKRLAEDVSDTCLVVMRVYFEKPRTIMGWKGFMYDPHLDGSQDALMGIHWTRELMLKLTEIKIPIASELLDPFSCHYFGDLISWGCIGARTSSSQIHRQIASDLPLPIGFKNNTDGNVEIAVNGIAAASEPHAYFTINEEGVSCCAHSTGNPDCHLVLRGGELGPNYDRSSIKLAEAVLRRAKLPARIVVDCSHDNSRRDHRKQPLVFRSVLDQILEGNAAIRGFSLESNLYEGNQPLNLENSLLKYGVSITDACIDWTTTESLVREAHEHLKQKNIKESELSRHMCSV